MKKIILFCIFAMGCLQNVNAVSVIGNHNYKSYAQQRIDLMKEQNSLLKEQVQNQRNSTELENRRQMDEFFKDMKNKFKD